MLSDRWVANVATSVCQEMLLRHQASDLDIPPAFVLRRQNPPEFFKAQIRPKYFRLLRLPEVSDDGVAPHMHQRFFLEAQWGNPAAFRFVQTAGRHQNVEMRIEIQTAAEGVLHHHNQHANTISGFHPLLYHRGSECGQVIEEMPVPLKDWPENVWHRKHDACIRDVGEGGPLLPLPQLGGTMPTTRTSSRFTGVVNEFLLGFRGIDFRAQSGGAASDHFCEVLADSGAGLGAVPVNSCGTQNLL